MRVSRSSIARTERCSSPAISFVRRPERTAASTRRSSDERLAAKVRPRDPAPLSCAEAMRSWVARAQAAAGDAKRELERKRDLLAKGSVAQAAFDRAESTASGADAAVLAAKATRDLARQRLEDAVLRSPIDGVVAEKRTDVGERMGEATVAFVIVQTSPLKLRFRLPERYLASVRLGQEVEAVPHQDVVVRLVPGGAAQPVDAGALGDGDPDLRDEDTLEVEGDDGLLRLPGHRAILVDRPRRPPVRRAVGRSARGRSGWPLRRRISSSRSRARPA